MELLYMDNLVLFFSLDLSLKNKHKWKNQSKQTKDQQDKNNAKTKWKSTKDTEFILCWPTVPWHGVSL